MFSADLISRIFATRLSNINRFMRHLHRIFKGKIKFITKQMIWKFAANVRSGFRSEKKFFRVGHLANNLHDDDLYPRKPMCLVGAAPNSFFLNSRPGKPEAYDRRIGSFGSTPALDKMMWWFWGMM